MKYGIYNESGILEIREDSINDLPQQAKILDDNTFNQLLAAENAVQCKALFDSIP